MEAIAPYIEPDVYLAHLGRVLSSAALVRFQANEVFEAISDVEQAIKVFEGLIEGGSLSFRIELVRANVNLSWFLSHTQQPRRAYRVAERSLAIARDLVEADSDRAAPELALALEAMASRSRAVRRRNAAAIFSAEALNIYENLIRRNRAPFALKYAGCLSNHSVYRQEADIEGDDSGFALRSVEIFNQLVAQDIQAYGLQAAMAWSGYAGVLVEAESWNEAVTLLDNAIAVFDKIPPSPGNRLRAAALRSNLGEVLRVAGRITDAMEASEAAMRLLERLDEEELGSIPGVGDAIKSNFNLLQRVIAAFTDV